jgi:HD-GYP domain-containing protein (c-di-GMP phosphodiesterase class II)
VSSADGESVRATASVVLAAVLGVLVTAAALVTVPAAGGMVVVFLAALVAAELVAVARDDALADPVEVEGFRISTPVLLAAMVVVGPWAAALGGAAAGLVGRTIRPTPWNDVLVRAVALGVAGLVGGYAFTLAGGHTGQFTLPDDLLPLCVLVAGYTAVRTVANGLTVGIGSLGPDLRTLAGEAALGLLLALAAVENAWLLVAVVPTMVLLEHAHHRLVVLRGEVAAALETFANIVDERDPSTHRHSVRVAASVEELARALGLPAVEVARLRWAGRLHDLGKVAVDTAVLRKRGDLTKREWAAVRRAPRLSARLLQRFRFAAQQAQAVEYHRERLDGSGYYGVAGDAIPLATHFLILADSYDAMTTDRPFRPALSREEALAEIERWSGTQFHPTLARAFAAVQRGVPVAEVLSAEELDALRDACTPQRRAGLGSVGVRLLSPVPVALVGGLVALVGISVDVLELAAVGAAAALFGAGSAALHEIRARRLSSAVVRALGEDWNDPELVFDRVAGRLQRAGASWIGLVAWNGDGLGGSIVRTLGDDGPEEAALVSWLVRHADTGEGVFPAGIFDLGSPSAHLAVPLRRETAELAGFLVLASPRPPAAHVTQSLGTNLHALGLALAPRPPARRPRAAARAS